MMIGSPAFPNSCLMVRHFDVVFTSFTFLKPIILGVVRSSIKDGARAWHEDALSAGLLDKKY